MTNHKPTIWIGNEAGHPYHRALDVVPGADLKPLTIGNVNPLLFDRLSYEIAKGIVNYVDREDYLLISGTPMISGIAVHLWLLHHGKIKILQWNAKRREYELIEKEADDMSEILQRELERV